MKPLWTYQVIELQDIVEQSDADCCVFNSILWSGYCLCEPLFCIEMIISSTYIHCIWFLSVSCRGEVLKIAHIVKQRAELYHAHNVLKKFIVAPACVFGREMYAVVAGLNWPQITGCHLSLLIVSSFLQFFCLIFHRLLSTWKNL